MPRSPKRWRSIRELSEGAADIKRWLDWERKSLELFHAYANRFGARAGTDVYRFALRDALEARGLTLEQFEKEVRNA